MPTSSVATIRPQGLEHEAQLVSDLLRLSRVTVLLSPQGSDAGTFLKRYVMPLLAAGAGTEEIEVCVFFDAWEGSPRPELLAEARNAVRSAKGTSSEIAEPAALSLVDALTAWQQALRVRFILVLDRFEKFLQRPADEMTLEFHRQLVDLLSKPRLRINVLISVDEEADPLLAPLRSAVRGFGEATLRLPGAPGPVAAAASSVTAQAAESVAVEVVPLKTAGAAASVDSAVPPVDHASAAALSAVAVTTAHPVVEASPAPTLAEPRDAVRETTDTTAEAATAETVNAPLPSDTEPQPISRGSRWGWFAVAGFLLFLLVLWILTPETKRPASPGPGASSVQPPQASSPEPLPPVGADAPKPAAQVQTPPPEPPPAAAAAPAAAPPVAAAPAAVVAPVTKGAEKKAPLDPPTLHIHVRNASQRAWAETLAARLARRGIRVSGIRLVSAGPSGMDVRYFRQDEAQEASEVARVLRDLGIGSPRLKHIGGYEDASIPRRYELWLAPVGGELNR